MSCIDIVQIMSCIDKLFSVLLARQLHDQQYAFRPGRGVLNALHNGGDHAAAPCSEAQHIHVLLRRKTGVRLGAA